MPTDRDFVHRLHMRALEDVFTEFKLPFEDIHHLEAWAAMAHAPAPALADQDLLPFIGPALGRMQLVRRLSNADVCQRAQIDAGMWQKIRQGEDVPFPEFTRAFLVITGGAFLPLREAGLLCQMEQRYALALQECEPAPVEPVTGTEPR